MLIKLRHYFFLMILLGAIIVGSLTGFLLEDKALMLKPLGDIFLNLLFTVVIPLIFFSVASAIASMKEATRVAKLMGNMMGVFLFTSLIAAIFMLIVVQLFPPAQGVFLKLPTSPTLQNIHAGEQIVHIFTVSNFYDLFSRENILALIFFAVLVGLGTAASGKKGHAFSAFLRSGTAVSMKLVSYVMYYAPIGFFAYFAVLVAQLGPQLLENYARAMAIYYSAAFIYFLFAYSFYAYLAARKLGILTFWKNSPLPIMTSLATCSSAASIPANLQATQQMNVPPTVYETVVPLGAILHKDGSVLGGMLKIAFLFGVFQLSFSGINVWMTALIISLLVGTAIGAIPSGGMISEMLILSLYGLPPQALIIIAAITILIDPPATMLNVLGNTVSSMLVARLVAGKNWLKNTLA